MQYGQGEGKYEYLQSHDFDKSTSFSRAMSWIAKNYNSANDVIQLQDRETGVVLVKAITPFIVFQNTRHANYTMEVRFKDNKSKITFDMTGLAASNGFYAQPGYAPPVDAMPSIVNNFQSIAGGIFKAIKDDPNDF